MKSIVDILPRGSLVVLVGSQQAGLLFHLERIRQTAPDVFMPVRTYTTFQMIRREFTPWLALVFRQEFQPFEVATRYFDQPLPLSSRYDFTVTYNSVIEALRTKTIALIGMNSLGYAQFRQPVAQRRATVREYDEQRWYSAIKRHYVIALEPDELSGFTESLATVYKLTPEQAVMCTEDVKRDSSVPPSSEECRPSGIYNVPLSSPNDGEFIEKLAHQLQEAS